MKMVASRLTPLACVAALALSVPAGAVTNLVRNGDFEDVAQPRSRQLSVINPDGSQTQMLTGWTNGIAYNDRGDAFDGYNFYVTPGTADLSPGDPAFNDRAIQSNQFGLLAIAGPGNGPNNGFVGSPTGGNLLMADGNFLVAPISQQIDGLIAGQTYTLSFDWSGGQQLGYTGANTEWWQVGFGDDLYRTYDITIQPQGFTGWQRAQTTFVASRSSQILTFLAQALPGGEPPMLMLDGVSLTGPTAAAIPEPGTWATMLAGFAAIGVALRRRRRGGAASGQAARAIATLD